MKYRIQRERREVYTSIGRKTGRNHREALWGERKSLGEELIGIIQIKMIVSLMALISHW